MSKEKEEVLTTTSSEGKTSFMVCKNTEEAKRQKVCMEIGNENQTKAQGETSQSSKPAANEKGILENNNYNLIEQLTVESKSLWRIKNNYKNDAAMDNESKELWNFIEKDKEEVVKLLTEKIKERL